MKKAHEYFVVPDREALTEMVARWEQGHWLLVKSILETAIDNGSAIPQEIMEHIPTISCRIDEKTISLKDFRGIDLSAKKIGNLDLSDCCFDGSNFSGVELRETCLQFSSFNHCDFSSSIWLEVQGSPISGYCADFRDSLFCGSFLMDSYLQRANLRGCRFLEGCALDGVDVLSADVNSNTVIEGSDVLGLNLLDDTKVRDWFAGQAGNEGAPTWTLTAVAESASTRTDARNTVGDSERAVNSLWKLWNWTEPFFGELTQFPEKEELFIGRGELLQEAAARLSRQWKSGRSAITLLAGSPGVGKSTFVEYLVRRHYENSGRRLSVLRYTRNPLIGNSPLGIDDLFSIFTQVEEFLSNMIADLTENGNGIQEAAVSVAPSLQKYKRLPTDDRSLAISIITEAIVEKATRISELRRSPNWKQYCLAIDDVDHISPRDQVDFLAILCAMADATPNPVVLYSARHAAASVAKYNVKSLLNHKTRDPIFVPALDPHDVIERRIRAQSDDAINPFSDPGARELLSSLSNGNLRIVLDYVEKASNEGGQFLDRNQKTFTRENLMRLLFGKEVADRKELALRYDAKQARDLPNVYLKFSERDPVPFVFIALLLIGEKQSVVLSHQFFVLFNELSLAFNRKGVGQRKESDDKILGYLEFCWSNQLIRRTEIIDLDSYLKISSVSVQKRLISGTTVELTPRGMECLRLSQQSAYQEISGFNLWRSEIRNNVPSRKRIVSNISEAGVSADNTEFLEALSA